MCISSFLSSLCPFRIECLGTRQIPALCSYVGLFLGLLFCSFGLHVCFLCQYQRVLTNTAISLREYTFLMIKGLEPRFLPGTKGDIVGEISLEDESDLMSAGPFPAPTSPFLHSVPSSASCLFCGGVNPASFSYNQDYSQL